MPLNGGFEYVERLGPGAEAVPLIAYLSLRYPHSSPSEWTARIESKLVLLDSKSARPATLLHAGQTLVWRRPPWQEPDAPDSFTILYADPDILAAGKPPGMPTLPGANFLRRTLLYKVREHAPDAAPVHRLGRWTSGVVLFGRTREARAALRRQWAALEVAKRYRALASGNPEWDTLTITDTIGIVPHPLLGALHAATSAGKPARTHVTVLERRADGFLCDARIETGRPHQIRIHLAAAGHPLVGDPLYARGGIPEPHSTALPGDPGYHLHAAELSFRHPRTADTMTIFCPPPPRLVRERGDDGCRVPSLGDRSPAAVPPPARP